MPSFPIVDSHVHLYDVERLRYDWLATVPKINRTSLLKHFDVAREEVEVDKIVFAEVAVAPGFHLQEASFIQRLANTDPRLCGMVVHAPLEKGADVEGDLVALMQNRCVRGVRRLIETERDPSFCLEPGFISAVKLLPKYQLSFDICVKHWAMVYALELVRRCPEVTFVLDHIGKPDIKNGLQEPWKQQIRELARMPNVVCKISGVITEAGHSAWRKDDVKPYIAHVIDQFGFDRVLYGSDWTVAELTHSYRDFVEILDEVVEGASESEKRKLYRDTAIRVYRLD
ncbi:amidohydrolase family protein [Paraburkholderia solitsugae]|uniref:amidohydrolase family protein n=1 Tax=Paraburkholderia solitsugae TaxID=2675748 RepID=UPI0015556CD8|nr:amidohydrolase family protein [Paraburkholderia solitsugae]